jgi:glycosyltransferase involved in cell wall biosynthesis
MPTVSVLMPAYNAARYIAQTLDSLLVQTFADWELVVVDDGSTDATPDILASYIDPRIHVIRQANGGEARARNTALDHATGEFIAFLDSDDLYTSNALSDMTAFMRAHPEFDAAFADGYFCDENDRPLMRLSEHRPGIYTGRILEQVVLSGSVITVPVCTIVRRAIIEQHHLRFDPQFVIGPDWDFWIRVARVAEFGYLDTITCLYRVHQTNITRTSGRQRRVDDLVRGRLKVMNSDWFVELSADTRRQFFFDLLLNLLKDDPDRQAQLLNSAPFQTLPAADQAALWRQVGVDRLQQATTYDFAVQCLTHAQQLDPADRKGRLMMAAVRLGGRPAALTVIRSWQAARQARDRIQRARRNGPKPVPAALRPMHN